MFPTYAFACHFSITNLTQQVIIKSPRLFNLHPGIFQTEHRDAISVAPVTLASDLVIPIVSV